MSDATGDATDATIDTTSDLTADILYIYHYYLNWNGGWNFNNFICDFIATKDDEQIKRIIVNFHFDTDDYIDAEDKGDKFADKISLYNYLNDSIPEDDTDAWSNNTQIYSTQARCK